MISIKLSFIFFEKVYIYDLRHRHLCTFRPNYIRYTFGYADDIVIIVQGKYAHTLREIMQEALNVVVKWAGKEGLNISPHKTVTITFTNSRKTEGIGPLKLHGKELAVVREVKYLGVILDSILNWNQHLQKIIRKAQTTFAIVRRICGKKMGS